MVSNGHFGVWLFFNFWVIKENSCLSLLATHKSAELLKSCKQNSECEGLVGIES